MANLREFRRTARIARPAQWVFAFIVDPQYAPAWVKGVKQATMITPGPTAVGSRMRFTRQVLLSSVKYEVEVLAFEPPRRFAVRSMEGKTAYVYTFDLADHGAVTDVFMHATIENDGVAGKLKSGMVANTWEAYEGTRLELLKKALEARP